MNLESKKIVCKLVKQAILTPHPSRLDTEVSQRHPHWGSARRETKQLIAEGWQKQGLTLVAMELAAVARPRRRGVGDFTGYDEPLRACAPAARVADRTGVRPDA